MSIHVRPLLGPYALACGETILARLKDHGAVPAMLKDEQDLWAVAQKELSLTPEGTEVRLLDPFLDRAALLPAHLCQEIVRAYAEVPVPLSKRQQQRVADARALLPVFGDDLRALVNIPFVEEWAAVREVLRRLREDPSLAGAVERLGLGDDVELCASLHAAYGKSLGIGADVDKDAPERKVAAWNDAFRALLVGASFLEKKNPGLYALFSEPYAEQLRRQQEMLSRQRSAKVAPSRGGDAGEKTPSPGGGA